LAIRRQLKEQGGIFNSLINVGLNAGFNGMYPQAHRYLKEAENWILDNIDEGDQHFYRPFVDQTKGDVYCQSGDFNTADITNPVFKTALKVQQEI